jgi:hypothetical protein
VCSFRFSRRDSGCELVACTGTVLTGTPTLNCSCHHTCVNRTRKSGCDWYTQCETLDERVPLSSCQRQRHTSHWQRFDNCASTRHRKSLDSRSSIDIVQYARDFETSSGPDERNSTVDIDRGSKDIAKVSVRKNNSSNSISLEQQHLPPATKLCAPTYLRIDKALIAALVFIDVGQELIHRLGRDIVTSNLGSRSTPRCYHEWW